MILRIFFTLSIASVCWIQSPAQYQQSEKPKGISVVGVGLVSVPPNLVEVGMQVEAQGFSAVLALDTMNAIVKKTIDGMREEGIADSQLVTHGFRVDPTSDYNYSSLADARKRYFRATMRITVKTNRINDVGRLVDKAVAAGVTYFEPPLFRATNEESIKTAAYHAAVKDARDKAQRLAESFGVRTGKLINSRVEMYDVQPQIYYDYRPEYTIANVKSVPTLILPNFVTKQAAVEATFEILDVKKN